MKVATLLGTPFTVTMAVAVPVDTETGTGTEIEVALQLAGVADIPLNVTVLAPCKVPKLVPAIVTDVPTGPVAGFRLVIVGDVLPPA